MNRSETRVETDESLSAIDRQRRLLAARVRLPWWYRSLVAVLLLGLLSTPITTTLGHGSVGVLMAQLPALLLVGLGLGQHRLLAAVTGVRLARDSFRVYPSTRPAMVSFVAVGVIGEFAVGTFVRHHANIAQPIAIVLVTAVIAMRCLDWQLAAIRGDLARGHVHVE